MYIHKNDNVQVCHSLYLDNVLARHSIVLSENITYIKSEVLTEVRVFVCSLLGTSYNCIGRTNQIKILALLVKCT